MRDFLTMGGPKPPGFIAHLPLACALAALGVLAALRFSPIHQ
ncbi:hypothetical protein [Falsiroseomonas oryziterrae]|nr:hypothetical protein [Roseomonas sp. NPKOSM-4]